MGLERLTNGIRKGVRNGVTAGLLGLSAIGIGGCATTLNEISEGEGMTLLGAMMSESNDSLSIKLAPYVALLGQMRYQKEVIREGRTQVNVPENVVYQNKKHSPVEGYIWVNPEDPNDLRVKRILGSGFAFRWVDYNRSGNADTWEEFVERRDRFRQDESIVLSLLYEAEEPIHQNLKVYSPSGRIVREIDINLSQKKYIEKEYCNISGSREEKYEIICMSIEDELTQDWERNSNRGLAYVITKEKINVLLGQYGEGEYSAVWRVNGKIMDSITFDIIH